MGFPTLLSGKLTVSELESHHAIHGYINELNGYFQEQTATNHQRVN